MISLETHNEKNVAFYRQFGFKVFGVMEKHFDLKQYGMIREVWEKEKSWLGSMSQDFYLGEKWLLKQPRSKSFIQWILGCPVALFTTILKLEPQVTVFPFMISSSVKRAINISRSVTRSWS